MTLQVRTIFDKQKNIFLPTPLHIYKQKIFHKYLAKIGNRVRENFVTLSINIWLSRFHGVLPFNF